MLWSHNAWLRVPITEISKIPELFFLDATEPKNNFTSLNDVSGFEIFGPFYCIFSLRSTLADFSYRTQKFRKGLAGITLAVQVCMRLSYWLAEQRNPSGRLLTNQRILVFALLFSFTWVCEILETFLKCVSRTQFTWYNPINNDFSEYILDSKKFT